MSELKRCPFCGGNNLSTYLSNQGSSVVYCINCYEDNNGLSRDIAGWNTRPLEDELQARITKLEAENAALKRNLSDALDCCFEKLLPIWRELPFSYQELKRKVKEVMK